MTLKYYLSILFLSITCFIQAATITIIANTNWSVITSGSGAGGLPNSSDIIIVKNGATLTVDVNNAIVNQVGLGYGGANAGTGTLKFNSASQLDLSAGANGDLILGSVAAQNGLLDMTSGGKLICKSFSNSSSNASLTPGSGTIQITGTAILLAPITTYNNLQINGNSTTLAVGITLNGTLEVLAGTLTTSTSNYSMLVNGDATVSSGATLSLNASAVSLRGNLSNSGTFTSGTSTVTFIGTSFQSISGSALTAFSNVTVNKGTDITSIVEAIPSGSGMSMSGTLTLTNGLLKLTHASASAQTSVSTTIASTAGIHINGGVLNGSNTTITNNGMFRVTSGTATVGNGSGNMLLITSSGTLDVKGGVLNAAGRLYCSGGIVIISGGVINICTVGLSNLSNATFEMSTTASLTMSNSPVITFQNANSGPGGDLLIVPAEAYITGGTFQMGNTSTPASQIFKINTASPIYNLTVNTTNSPTARLVTNTLTVNNNVLISGGTLDAATNNLNMIVKGNWTKNGGTFSGGNATVTFNGSTLQNVNGSSSTTFNSITINNSNGITLGIATSVAGALALTNGNITTTATNLLTLTTTATSTSGSSSSFVSGPMNKQGSTDFIFPVGKGTRWRRVAATNLSGNVEFQAEYFNVGYGTYTVIAPLTQVSRLEYWNLDRVSGNPTAKVTLYWEDAAASGINSCASMTIAHWKSNGNASTWEEYKGTASGSCSVNGAGSVLNNSNQNSFSPFTFGSIVGGGINPLPIELFKFDAKLNKSVIDLKWTTTSETNSDFFTIERTIDGVNFKTIGTVKGAGNSVSVLNYTVIDKMPYNGVAYYRLKQTDFDGSFSHSDLKTVIFEQPTDFSFNIYPNPSNGVFNLQAQTNKNEEVILVVCDLMGNKIYSKSIIICEGDNNVKVIDLSNTLTPGVFLITAYCGDKVFNKRLLVE